MSLCPRSKASRPSGTILTVSLCLSLADCAMQSQSSLLKTQIFPALFLLPQISPTLPWENYGTKIIPRRPPPASELTFLRWTEILFFVYVTLARPSAGIPWEKQHLSPFYRKNFKQSCWLVFPNVAFFFVTY